jgi:SAM-dependent methyltransferase
MAALKQAPGGEALLRDLTANPGPDFLQGIPWETIDTVLDVGSGLGFLAAPLARSARKVVALEPLPENARFLARRAVQDGLNNLHVLLADPAALPFAPGSFDLVTVSGILEVIGLWSQGDPRRLQQELLARASALLRPGGYIYLAFNTRYGLKWWLGKRDHSGLPYVGLLPRALADCYCRLRGAGASSVSPVGYRTCRQTPEQYRKMLGEVGFNTVEVYGCFPRHTHQVGLYPLADYEARREMRDVLDPPTSWLSALRHRLCNSRWLYHKLEDEIILFGKKGAPGGPLVWTSARERAETVTQLNTFDKVCLIEFARSQPRAIGKAGKRPVTLDRLQKEFAFLSAAQAHLEKEADTLPLRWPRPRGEQHCNGMHFFRYEYAKGSPLLRLLTRGSHTRTFPRVFGQLSAHYVDLCSRLSRALEPVRSELGHKDDLADLLGEAYLEDRNLRALVKEGCNKLRAGVWPLSCTHGDLALSNAVAVSPSQTVLIDWENASAFGLVAVDLIRLLYDIRRDTGCLSTRVQETVRDSARTIVQDHLAQLGIQAEDVPLLEALFVAEQLQFLDSRGDDAEPLLRDYQTRPLGPGR